MGFDLRRVVCACIAGALVAGLSAGPLAQRDEERRVIASPYAEIELTPFEAARDGAIALQVTVRPRPGIHIYAPGQRGYYPVSVTFAAESGLTPAKLDLPPAEPYVFEPTGERFLVYRQPFAMTQHVRVARGASAARASRLSGTLHYQACDDRVCYRPQAVRLEWSRRRPGARGAGTGRTG